MFSFLRTPNRFALVVLCLAVAAPAGPAPVSPLDREILAPIEAVAAELWPGIPVGAYGMAIKYWYRLMKRLAST